MSRPTIRTPSNLEVLIHCYVSPEPHPRRDAPAVKEALYYLHANGLIDQALGLPKVTDKGKFYIKHLLSQPFPVESYAIPEAAE